MLKHTTLAYINPRPRSAKVPPSLFKTSIIFVLTTKQAKQNAQTHFRESYDSLMACVTPCRSPFANLRFAHALSPFGPLAFCDHKAAAAAARELASESDWSLSAWSAFFQVHPKSAPGLHFRTSFSRRQPFRLAPVLSLRLATCSQLSRVTPSSLAPRMRARCTKTPGKTADFHTTHC